MKFIRSQNVSGYNIGQWDCLGEEETRFVVMSAFVSYPSDSALALIFEDTRVALVADKVKAAMQDELAWLEGRPARLWASVLAAIDSSFGWTALRLRSDILSGAHISAAYFSMKTMALVERHPWCIARGDMYRNLDELKAAPQPDQATAAKYGLCCKFGATTWRRSRRAFACFAMRLGAHRQLSKGTPWAPLSSGCNTKSEVQL